MGFFQNLIDRVLPKTPDFFALLSEQSHLVTETIRNLEYYMSTNDSAIEKLLTEEEHLADIVKKNNLHILNTAFSTPIDREDIYRAIMALDFIITHCKSTVNEMVDLQIEPDEAMQKITQELLLGCRALETGFKMLSKDPLQTEQQASIARRSHRNIQRLYRSSLAQLFQGEVSTAMLSKREIYHHLMDGSKHLYSAANVMQDIMVKLV